ncbi:MAG: glycyl-radical enzyme activating protein [Lachnospiraceae bacterium]|nr:glycyl-radical enzyme activating protein [Lachnospiraceae bacterium]
MKGTIFDIRRFSTHDGEGLRTTIFMKGCPLRCVWCQNPEGIPVEIYPMHFSNQCVGCKTCLKVCKFNGIWEENGKIHIDRNAREDWAAISDACPAEAIVLDGKVWNAEDVLKEVKKDKVFFRHGGGVTISGGEPLMQADFVVEIFQKLKEEGIHTAIETSLGVSKEAVEKVVPYVDQIFADMKLETEELHKKYTGVSNVQIKKNLTFLLTSPYKEKVTIRTPLIPEHTATEENLSGIAEYISGLYPEVKYELLNYNPLAEAKYHLVERSYCFEENPKLYTKEQMIAFGEIVKAHGIKRLIMEL